MFPHGALIGRLKAWFDRNSPSDMCRSSSVWAAGVLGGASAIDDAGDGADGGGTTKPEGGGAPPIRGDGPYGPWRQCDGAVARNWEKREVEGTVGSVW